MEEKQLLFVNATVAPERSRTRRLALAVIERMAWRGTQTEERLETLALRPLDTAALQARAALCEQGAFHSPIFDLAQRFRAADAIVIAAPYWDLSFPAMLKCYLEQVMVGGLTFRYREDGSVEGLCRAEELIYVTSAGGFIGARDYGFAYVQALAQEMFGIPRVARVACEGLDLVGSDPEAILAAAIAAL